jgi:hypothetical protein
MTVMLDIVFSSVLGGVIAIIVVNANLVIKEAVANFNSDVVVQQMLITDAQIVESEFRNMGSGVPSGDIRITQATDTCVSFKMALRPEPWYEPTDVKYYPGSRSELTWTDNPDDRYLYRQESTQTPQTVGIVSKFSIKYFNFINEVIVTPEPDSLRNIAIVEVTMEVQNPFNSFVDENGKKHFASALWKQTRLASQNLRR